MGLNFGQNLFPARGEPFINFAFEDVARQTGYLIYYPLKTNAGDFFVTTDSTLNSEIDGTYGEATSPTEDNGGDTFARRVFITIDLTFNNPINLEGDMLFSIPIGVQEPSSGDTFLYCKLESYHYDGSTETQIGSTTNSIILQFDEDNILHKGEDGGFLPIKITTGNSIHFKAGEKLRVKIGAWGRTTGAGGTIMGIGHNPTNSSFLPIIGADDEDDALSEYKQTWYLPVKTNT